MIEKSETLRVLRKTIDKKESLQVRDYIQHNLIPRYVHHNSCWSKGVLVSDGLSVALGDDIETILKDPVAYSGPAMFGLYQQAIKDVDFGQLHHMEAVFHFVPIPGLYWHVTGIPVPDVLAICWEGLVKPTTVEPYVKVVTKRDMQDRRMMDLIEKAALGGIH